MSGIPITVFTGFLGAGKTSVILSLLPLLPKDYKLVLLKNEFGDIEVDSKLAEHSSLTAVSEILNGCLCCVLVGQMETALLEISEKYRPDRIIIECSGSAFPATLAFQIRKLERETGGLLKLDAIVTVIDAENFIGYEDNSPTAKMQASYTDLIIINKWEHVSERALDIVLDHLNTLNDQTPKIRCQCKNSIDPNLIFGLESRLFSDINLQPKSLHHEVEIVTIYRDIQTLTGTRLGKGLSKVDLQIALGYLSKDSIWRVKGYVRLCDETTRGTHVYILNWAFGRYELTLLEEEHWDKGLIRFTAMGGHGEVKRASRLFVETLGASIQ
ncbi:hypothetical protein AMATHDRAFT_198955 [Amanita thiersii Skay4041]|uniref:CobW/HypB/UreG nucleotide-binding domain-containing protein n=1 Tax=Amanita thiersii Skay4041 TaxID=703135 RepID=A0A2A9NBV6_9AGAR|nr:hypothetical protein AMATHDRAFT_198955 [Amanita thiersii Skay4041]